MDAAVRLGFCVRFGAVVAGGAVDGAAYAVDVDTGAGVDIGLVVVAGTAGA